MDKGDFGIDIEGVRDPESFINGMRWMIRAIRSVNDDVRSHMVALDGEMADGVRLTLDAQEKNLKMCEDMIDGTP